MKIKRQELLKALEIVKPGLANKELIEQSTSFAFMKDRVVTYNDEISVSHPVEGLDLTGAIPAQEFYQLLQKTKKEEIELTVEGGEILLNMGADKAGIARVEEIRLPLEEISHSDKWKPISPQLIEAIQFCMFSCSRDMSRPILTCVHVKKDGGVEASDNQRITRYQTDQLPIESFLLPATSAKEVINPDICEISEGKGWVHFRTKAGTVYSCRVYAEDYPDTSKLFDVEGIEIKLPKTLSDLLEKAIIFTKTQFLFDQRVQITLTNNKMKVRAEKESSGWFEGEVNIRFKSDPVSFAIHPQFLQEIITKTQTGLLGERIMKFEGENWEHVVALMIEQ